MTNVEYRDFLASEEGGESDKEQIVTENEEDKDELYKKYLVNQESQESIDDLEKLQEKEIANSTDFRDLLGNVINRHDDWKYSDGEAMDTKVLAETINAVRTGEKEIKYITSRYGLRAKVQKLLDAEGGIV